MKTRSFFRSSLVLVPFFFLSCGSKPNPHAALIEKLAKLETQLESGADWENQVRPLTVDIRAELKLHPVRATDVGRTPLGDERDNTTEATVLVAQIEIFEQMQATMEDFNRRHGYDLDQRPEFVQKVKTTYRKALQQMLESASHLRQQLTAKK